MRILSFIAVLFVTACGFTPMYATQNNSTVKSSLDQVGIAIIPDRSGQYLRNALIDRFYRNGYPTAPRYKLTVQPIKETISNFDVTLESEATRQQIKLSTKIMLINVETNKSVLTRSLTAVTSNNILESEFSTLITEQSARDAALNDLARQIERQLSLYFSH
jgi:LPS-assembly lipoprotein